MKKHIIVLLLLLLVFVMLLFVYRPDMVDPFVYQESKEGVVDYIEQDVGVYVRVKGSGLYFVHSDRLDSLSKGQLVKVSVYSRRFTGRKRLMMEYTP